MIRVYDAILKLPDFEDDVDRADPQDVKNEAILEGENASNYQPHKTVLTPVAFADQLYLLIWAILLFLFGLSTYLGWKASEYVLHLLDLHSFEIHSLVTGVPAMAYSGVIFYVFFLQRNTKFVQEMNRDLRIPVRRINRRGVKTRRLMTYKIWNRSLRSNRKLPVMYFLVLLRKVAPRIYDFVVDGLVLGFPKVYEQETTLWRLCGRLYALFLFRRFKNANVRIPEHVPEAPD